MDDHSLNYIFFLTFLYSVSELNFNYLADVFVDIKHPIPLSFSTHQISQSFCRRRSFLTCTFSLKYFTASLRVTSSCPSLESGKSMIWQVIQHQLVAWPTTSLHQRTSSTFKETHSISSFTASSWWVVAQFSQESGSTCQVKPLVMSAVSWFNRIWQLMVA